MQVGCGADELIDLLMRCVLEPGDAIVDCPPTFTMYAFDADVNNGRVITVPRLDGFKIDLEGVRSVPTPLTFTHVASVCEGHYAYTIVCFRRAVETHKPKMVFLTSPNNPDGSMMTDEEVRAIFS